MTAAVAPAVVVAAAVEVSAPQVQEIAVRREEVPVERINYFFHPGVRSPSYGAQRQAANGLLNAQIGECIGAAKRPRVRAPKREPTMDLFDKKVSQRVRIMAFAVPMVVASMAADCLATPNGAGVPLEREFARRALWRSLRLVCRAFNELMLINTNMLWQAWFDALPAFYRQRGDVRFVLRCSHERAFAYVVCKMQKSWNKKNAKQWLTETVATFECYRACRRALVRSRNPGTEFLFAQVCAQLEQRGLFVDVPDAADWPWNELPPE
jgi:hypothetical protein